MNGHEVWKAFVSGSSEPFIDLFRKRYEENGDVGAQANLGFALLDVGKSDEAASIFEDVNSKQKYLSDAGLIILGVCYWFSRRVSEAMDSWHRALRAEYTDSAGGISGPTAVWYGALRLNDKALCVRMEEKLSKFWRKDLEGRDHKGELNWPRPIAAYLTHQIDSKILLEWHSRNEILEVRRLCQAHFWIAVKSPDVNEARKHFLNASENKRAILEFEYFLAKWELEQSAKSAKRVI